MLIKKTTQLERNLEPKMEDREKKLKSKMKKYADDPKQYAKYEKKLAKLKKQMAEQQEQEDEDNVADNNEQETNQEDDEKIQQLETSIETYKKKIAVAQEENDKSKKKKYEKKLNKALEELKTLQPAVQEDDEPSEHGDAPPSALEECRAQILKLEAKLATYTAKAVAKPSKYTKKQAKLVPEIDALRSKLKNLLGPQVTDLDDKIKKYRKKNEKSPSDSYTKKIAKYEKKLNQLLFPEPTTTGHQNMEPSPEVQEVSEEDEKKTMRDFFSMVKKKRMNSNLQLCFLVDLTHSMQPWLRAVHETVVAVVQDFIKTYPAFGIRVAFVGYKDVDVSDQDRYVTLPFSQDVEVFISTLKRIKCGGGDDVAEDVLGGIAKTAELTWDDGTSSSLINVLVHVADAPGHGNMYKADVVKDCSNDFYDNMGTVTEAQYEQALKTLGEHVKNYFFLHVENPLGLLCGKMAAHFQSKFANTFAVIDGIDVSNKNEISAKFLDVVKKSIAVSVTAVKEAEKD